ncbi:cytochrome P450 [Streptomyces sp. NPDC058755]|uniref:cytochrome P450 n=1 Tax=Streptomyces sp. NPDC058755 TaxID=3346624 RepID=UPI0036CBC949
MVANAAVLMFGGIETTEGVIANAVLHLLAHPGQLALVRADPDLVDAAIEESLRLEPAAAAVDRYATADVTIGGADVRRGDLVVVSLAGANRDPEILQDPDGFDLGRGNSRLQLAFAHGPHFCLGAHLARLETAPASARFSTVSPACGSTRPRPPRPGVWPSGSPRLCASARTCRRSADATPAYLRFALYRHRRRRSGGERFGRVSADALDVAEDGPQVAGRGGAGEGCPTGERRGPTGPEPYVAGFTPEVRTVS